MKKIGVVADDVTGANDIGIMFAKNNLNTCVFPMELIDFEYLECKAESLDVIIIDTNSRFDSVEDAKEKVKTATEMLKKLNCDMYMKKTCSVFRGNAGSEFDAMQDTLGVKNSIVIAGYPRNARTTVGGIHYVGGVKLSESQFKNDPIHKMTISSLNKIIGEQSDRKCSNILAQDLDKGKEHVQKKLEELKKDSAYIIFDVRDQDDLAFIADVIKDEKTICGSAAIAETLPVAWKRREGNTLVMVGSLTKQSIGQVQYLRENGYPIISFDASKVFDESKLEDEISKIVHQAREVLKTRNKIVVHTPNEKEAVQQTKESGSRLGLTEGQIGKKISYGMYRITREIMSLPGYWKLVVAGGDTSASIVEGLNIKEMKILNEIEVGLPTMEGYTDLGEIGLVLKSGSFGSDAFLEKAINSL